MAANNPATARRPGRGTLALLAAVAFLWAGLVTGISFLEAPIKFQALAHHGEEGRLIGLEIGKAVFAILALVERILVAPLVVLAFLAGGRGRWLTLVIALIVLWQGVHLTPVLDEQIDSLVAAGGGHIDTWHHTAFIAIEILKLLLLLTVGGMALRRLTSPADDGAHTPEETA